MTEEKKKKCYRCNNDMKEVGGVGKTLVQEEIDHNNFIHSKQVEVKLYQCLHCKTVILD